MVEVSGDMVEGSNRKGLVVSLPKEVESALKDAGDCVLDGELVGDKFWIFDVLSLSGTDRSALSFAERADLRDALPLPDSAHAQAVTTYRLPADKTAAYAAIKNAKQRRCGIQTGVGSLQSRAAQCRWGSGQGKVLRHLFCHRREGQCTA